MLKDAQILKNYLRNNGITQGQLADKLGMSRQNLVFHLAKDKFSLDFTERLRGIGIDLSNDKFTQITADLRQQPHTNAAPVLNRDQESVLLMAINSSTYANTELLCRALAILEKRPLDEIKKEATELTRERARRVEQVLDQLTLVPSSNNSKSDSNYPAQTISKEL